jgi:hypothetical protein
MVHGVLYNVRNIVHCIVWTCSLIDEWWIGLYKMKASCNIPAFAWRHQLSWLKSSWFLSVSADISNSWFTNSATLSSLNYWLSLSLCVCVCVCERERERERERKLTSVFNLFWFSRLLFSSNLLLSFMYCEQMKMAVNILKSLHHIL